MKDLINQIRYLPSHEWGRIDEIGILTVGISDHAQDLLGDIVFVELPEIGKYLDAEEESAIVESVKAASDIYSPIDGEIIEINNDLTKDASVINQDAENEGWIFKLKISDSSQINSLMSLEEYNDFLKNE